MYSVLVPELDSIFAPASDPFEPGVTCPSLFGANPVNCCPSLDCCVCLPRFPAFPFSDRVFRSFGRSCRGNNTRMLTPPQKIWHRGYVEEGKRTRPGEERVKARRLGGKRVPVKSERLRWLRSRQGKVERNRDDVIERRGNFVFRLFFNAGGVCWVFGVELRMGDLCLDYFFLA